MQGLLSRGKKTKPQYRVHVWRSSDPYNIFINSYHNPFILLQLVLPGVI